jgi:hypothetical protein
MAVDEKKTDIVTGFYRWSSRGTMQAQRGCWAGLATDQATVAVVAPTGIKPCLQFGCQRQTRLVGCHDVFSPNISLAMWKTPPRPILRIIKFQDVPAAECYLFYSF